MCCTISDRTFMVGVKVGVILIFLSTTVTTSSTIMTITIINTTCTWLSAPQDIYQSAYGGKS